MIVHIISFDSYLRAHLTPVGLFFVKASVSIGTVMLAGNYPGLPRRFSHVFFGFGALAPIVGVVLLPFRGRIEYLPLGLVSVTFWTTMFYVNYSHVPTYEPKEPGTILAAVARTICSRRTYELVFASQIADLQFEYGEALNDGRRTYANWVLLRGWVSFWESFALPNATWACRAGALALALPRLGQPRDLS